MRDTFVTNLAKLAQNDEKISIVLNISVSLETVKKRISGRSICSNCGIIYNEYFNPPPTNSSCCSPKSLQKRTDDTLDVATKRFQNYEKNTKPLMEFYRNSNLLKVVNGESTITEINAEISGLIESNEG